MRDGRGPDGSNASLQVEWYSDKDGLVGTSLPDSAGAVDFSTADLSNDTHTISMRVEDSYGATCIANVVMLSTQHRIVNATGRLYFVANEPVLFPDW